MAAEQQASIFSQGAPVPIALSDAAAWERALTCRRPVLGHLNADTTWLLQLPYPSSSPGPSGRTHFNILMDPWLRGPQSDVASWFSTQWHVVQPTVETVEELDALLARLEGRGREAGKSAIDAVVISHEFTDHCHQATLLEVPASTPVFATDKAAGLVRSWSHFENVVTMAAFPGAVVDDTNPQITVGHALLPPWIGIARVVTEGNALYYHSAVLISFSLNDGDVGGRSATEAIIYSPHGVKGSDLTCVEESGIRTLALLHGLHDVRIWMTKQLNLGALNGLEAVRASGAKYWIATHDEAKRGGGLISWFLQRTCYTLGDAVQSEEARQAMAAGEEGARTGSSGGRPYHFLELASGEGLVLEG
ncbi:Major facilitator superfamily protein [Coniochaeta hoffmannii]|uniref:Major facilitator superfamily protein n=1 Tax=Coniochaeta hoffmannii TaxID=91930 RepID=A0AA38VUB5_9PEZI|nr:Major facilitator superfamily protein [Coniochaeta hoffmannii]